MPRNSRSKSHKQSKHSSKDYSDLDDNNNGMEMEVSVRVSKDSLISGEERKLDVNESVSDEFTPTKRRKEKNSGSDRWNDVDDVVVNIDDKKLKVVVESKSKSSRKHDGEGGGSAVLEKTGGGGSRGEKRLDKESGRKKGSEVKGNKSGRDTQIRDEWPLEDEPRNIESEKELKKRIKRSEGYNDLKEGDERMLLSKIACSQDIKQREDKRGENGERVSKSREIKYRTESEKDNKYNGDKHCEEGERDIQQEDKHREDSNRDNRYKSERYREDVDRDHRHKNWRAREDAVREKRDRDLKKLKDDSDRQTNNRGESPMYDDRGARHKDNKDRKRENANKDEYTDYRTRGIKNQYSESEKRSVSDAKLNPISERGRPSSCSDDMEITANHSRRRNSPEGKSYPSRDHYRVSRQERGYVDEERKSDKVSSRPLEKIGQKDDNRTEDLSLERHPRSDARSSPVVDICYISPSSTSNEHRHLNRLNVRRNLDVEELRPRSGGSKDSKEYSDNQFGVGSSEDDRSKLNNHNRRSSGDPNMGRPQNSWNNFSDWSSSPLPNSGYMPFHHGPTIFNPVMQQQYMPAMFGRPPMSMNHPGMPFPGLGNPGAWRNQVMESIPPSLPLHVWEPNTPLFGNGPPGYANWDHIRPQLNNQIWESNADMQSAGQKVDQTVQEPVDDVLSAETDPHVEENRPVVNAPEVVKVTESSQIYKAWKEGDAHISRVYLSKIGISEDLTEPELYDQCKSMLGSDQESVSDGSDCKILFFEGGLEAESSDGTSLYCAIDDSVFKKAMTLYTKRKVHFGAMNQEGVLNVSEPVSIPDQEKSDPVDDEKLVEEVLEDPVLEVKKEKDEPPIRKLDLDPMNEGDVVDNDSKKSDASPEEMDMEVDHHVENQGKESCAPSVGGCEVSVKVKDTSNSYNGSIELDKPSGGDSLLHLTNVSTTELLESGSVNLSRIHDHSPESTH